MGIDYLIKDGFVIDGTGNDTVKKMDIAIEDDCIKEIGELSHFNAEKVINVKGLYVCPGFIDVHAHSDFILLADGRAEGKISQGVTTEINGNCGLSAAPLVGHIIEQREKNLEELNIKDRWFTFSEYFALLKKKKIAINFMTLVGHGNLRASVVGYADKSLSKTEMKKVKAFLRDSIEAGAKGLSTGLIYSPGIYADTPEIIELARETEKYKGIYTTHMRSEGDRLLESVEEVIKIANESKIRVHISHLKTSDKKNWGKIEEVFKRINNAIENGVDITCDRYPYIASSTELDAILPIWVFEGGHKREIERLKNDQKRLANDILRDRQEEFFWENIIISSVSLNKNKWMEGKSLSEICKSLNSTPLKIFFDILIEEDLNVDAIFFSMNEENLRSILSQSYTMIGTDSGARSFSGVTAKGKPHPRGFGSYAKILGTYVREQGLMTLSEAIYKMTGLPAKTFDIKRRGVIAKGYFADITVFDPKKINDVANFNNPFQRPEGVYHVFINGTPVLLEGKLTGALPGKILR